MNMRDFAAPLQGASGSPDTPSPDFILGYFRAVLQDACARGVFMLSKLDAASPLVPVSCFSVSIR